MLSYWRAARAAKAARRAYDLAVLEGLIAENDRRLAEIAEANECQFCRAATSFRALSA